MPKDSWNCRQKGCTANGEHANHNSRWECRYCGNPWVRGGGAANLSRKGAGKDKDKDKDNQEIEDTAAASVWECFCGAKGLTGISCRTCGLYRSNSAEFVAKAKAEAELASQDAMHDVGETAANNLAPGAGPAEPAETGGGLARTPDQLREIISFNSKFYGKSSPMVVAAQTELDHLQAKRQAAWSDTERLRNITFKVRAAETRLEKSKTATSQATDMLAKIQRDMEEKLDMQRAEVQKKALLQQDRQADLDKCKGEAADAAIALEPSRGQLRDLLGALQTQTAIDAAIRELSQRRLQMSGTAAATEQQQQQQHQPFQPPPPQPVLQPAQAAVPPQVLPQAGPLPPTMPTEPLHSPRVVLPPGALLAAAAGRGSNSMEEEAANIVDHDTRSREELHASEVKIFGSKSDSPEAKRAKQDELDNPMHETAAIEEETRAALQRAEDERLQAEFREAEEKEATARAEEERRRAAAAGKSDTLPGCAKPAAAPEEE